jgi:acyl-coenzyme A thioesterase PaaI-like protein
MQLRFFRDDGEENVIAEYTPPPQHSGAPNYAHGGASMAVLDDAMAWAIIELKERFGVTRRSETDFVRPIKVGEPHTVRAWVESWQDRDLVARAELRDADDKLCVATRATYVVLTPDEARAAIGSAAEAPTSYTEPLP